MACSPTSFHLILLFFSSLHYSSLRFRLTQIWTGQKTGRWCEDRSGKAAHTCSGWWETSLHVAFICLQASPARQMSKNNNFRQKDLRKKCHLCVLRYFFVFRTFMWGVWVISCPLKYWISQDRRISPRVCVMNTCTTWYHLLLFHWTFAFDCNIRSSKFQT